MTQFRLTPEVCKAGPFKGYARLDWIHSAARKRPAEKVHALMHHFTVDNLRRAFQELDGSRAPGIDRVTKQEYRKELQRNLEKLQERIRKGGWRPRPSREVLIPKPQGGMRPLAIGCLEDKIVQLLTARILEALYEPQFHRHSFGFRRGRSAHQATARLYEVIEARSANAVVLEIDIEKFFNSIEHDRLIEILEEKIADPFFLRHIRRLLRCSVLLTDGKLAGTETGTPQGSPVSPILANICLNAILDRWFQQEYSGKGELVRDADDAVFVFTDRDVARRYICDLEARMNHVGLKLNRDKCKVVPFSSASPEGTCSFLGFTFYWGKNRSKQKLLKVKTNPKRLHQCMMAFEHWIKAWRNRKKLASLWDMAAAKLTGHYQYFGVVFNQSKLNHFYWNATQVLFKWLNRRSQKRSFTHKRFLKRLEHEPLPRPPTAADLVDITRNHGSVWNRKPKSPMRENRKSGSERSANLGLVFT